MSGIDIFISHSNQDTKIAELLIELLRAALNIPQDRIRCTSVDGYRLPAGVSTEDRLRQEVLEAKVLVGLITSQSIQSAYVLFELGARWGTNRDLAPVLAAGADPNILRGPLKSLNALSCDNPSQIHQLVGDIGRMLGESPISPSAYQKQLDALLQQSRQESETRVDAQKDILVRESDTDVVHLLDRYGLPHPVKDRNTALYLVQMLGYEPDELRKVLSRKLRPLGPEVVSINQWRPPKTEEEERISRISYEGSTRFKILKKDIRTESGSSVLSIYVKNESTYDMVINSAKLVVNTGELAEADISSRNHPATYGFPTCNLLFDGERESKSMTAQESSRLDLVLSRQLTSDDSERIRTVKIGYIEITGVYREAEVDFHKDV